MTILVKLSLLIESNQSTNTKLKCKHSCKQYLQLKSNKWEFKWWCRCSSSSHLYETHFHPGKKQEREYNLDESVMLNLWEILIAYYILANFSVALIWLQNYFIMTYIELVQFIQIAKWSQNLLMIKAWSWEPIITNTPKSDLHQVER